MGLDRVKACADAHCADASRPAFVRSIVDPINALKGDRLPVSAFNAAAGTARWDNGTAAYEESAASP